MIIDGTIVLLLHGRQLHVNHSLLLRLQRLLHILLHSTKHEWLQLSMQLLQLRGFFHVAVVRLEGLTIAEFIRLQEVQQRPQFLRIILQDKKRTHMLWTAITE